MKKYCIWLMPYIAFATPSIPVMPIGHLDHQQATQDVLLDSKKELDLFLKDKSEKEKAKYQWLAGWIEMSIVGILNPRDNRMDLSMNCKIWETLPEMYELIPVLIKTPQRRAAWNQTMKDNLCHRLLVP